MRRAALTPTMALKPNSNRDRMCSNGENTDYGRTRCSSSTARIAVLSPQQHASGLELQKFGRADKRRGNTMPTAEDFREVLNRLFYEAFKKHQDSVEINAGEMHRLAGDYPGTNHRMPLCCSVMRSKMDADAGDAVLSAPPGGDGASLTSDTYCHDPLERKANGVTEHDRCSPKLKQN
jgi:hypothetical protein